MTLQHNLAISNNLTQPESWNKPHFKALKLTYSLFLMIYAGIQKWFNLAGMQDFIDLCKRLLNGEQLAEFEEFDPVEEKIILSDIDNLYGEIKVFSHKIKQIIRSPKTDSSEKQNFYILLILERIKNLLQYKKLLQHPVYFNEYKDKYNHTYIQARTFVKDEKDKKKWFAVHLGIKPENSPINEFASETIKHGKLLIRKKILKYYK